MSSSHDNHGQSVASWTAVGLLMLAAAIIAIAFPLHNLVLGVVGVVIAVAGLVAGKVLASAGYGVNGRS